jgi:hypothetical protein
MKLVENNTAKKSGWSKQAERVTYSHTSFFMKNR